MRLIIQSTYSTTKKRSQRLPEKTLPTLSVILVNLALSIFIYLFLFPYTFEKPLWRCANRFPYLYRRHFPDPWRKLYTAARKKSFPASNVRPSQSRWRPSEHTAYPNPGNAFRRLREKAVLARMFFHPPSSPTRHSLQACK